MAERYNFKYLPLVGKLPGKSMVEQTETAINELASVVYDNVSHVGNLAKEVQTANTNASNALDKATEALETSGRVYVKQIAAVNVNDYYDSELYYIDNDGSTNIPVRDSGFLEVKTNDDKTACEQVFIADSTGTPYYRHGRITEQTLGEETTYVVTWSSWYRVATTEFVNAKAGNYLPLSGGTLTGAINFNSNSDVDVTSSTRHSELVTSGRDKNNLLLGADFYSAINTDVFHGFRAVNPIYNGDNWADIRVHVGTNGKQYISADYHWSLTDGTEDNSNHIPTTAFIHNKYLSLAGGSMSGAITTSAFNFIKRNVNNSHLTIMGGTGYGNSASILLNGGESSSNAGEFQLLAHNGTTGRLFIGTPNGTLTWGGNNILTAANYNSYALPLSGGTLTGVVNGVTPPVGDDSKKLATTEFVNTKASAAAPTGVVQAFAGKTIPRGWLLCDGSAVSRTNYAALYAVIGTTYGAGNGSTTFNLPNLVDKFVEGSATAGTVKSAGLPNITGTFGKNYTYQDQVVGTGAVSEQHYSTGSKPSGNNVQNGAGVIYSLDASRSSSVYGNSTTVQPPALTMRYIIKY